MTTTEGNNTPPSPPGGQQAAKRALKILAAARRTLESGNLHAAHTRAKAALEQITTSARINREAPNPSPTMEALHAAHEATLEASQNLEELVPHPYSKHASKAAELDHPNNRHHALHGIRQAENVLSPPSQAQFRGTTSARFLATTTAMAATIVATAYAAAALISLLPSTVPEPTSWPSQLTWPPDMARNKLTTAGHTVTATAFAALTCVNMATALRNRWTTASTVAALAATTAAVLPQVALLALAF